jgi:VanZ family protein
MTLFRLPKVRASLRWDNSSSVHWLAVLIFYWLGMTVASHLPVDFSQVPGLDKVLHCVAFAGLTFLASRFCLRFHHSPWWLAAVFAAACSYATADELSQTLLSMRVCDVNDWLADVSGAGVGVAVALSVRCRESGSA